MLSRSLTLHPQVHLDESTHVETKQAHQLHTSMSAPTAIALTYRNTDTLFTDFLLLDFDANLQSALHDHNYTPVTFSTSSAGSFVVRF